MQAGHRFHSMLYTHMKILNGMLQCGVHTVCNLSKNLIFMYLYDSIKRSNCYMVWAGESTSPGQGRNNNGLEIGCQVDCVSGVLTFTSNGKELSTFYQVTMTLSSPFTWC